MLRVIRTGHTIMLDVLWVGSAELPTHHLSAVSNPRLHFIHKMYGQFQYQDRLSSVNAHCTGRLQDAQNHGLRACNYMHKNLERQLYRARVGKPMVLGC
jgi:hypothetical protein